MWKLYATIWIFCYNIDMARFKKMSVDDTWILIQILLMLVPKQPLYKTWIQIIQSYIMKNDYEGCTNMLNFY